MTKYEWPDVIPDFDVLKWKQETQEKNFRETQGMTREEIRERIRQGAENFRSEGKYNQVNLESEDTAASI